MRCKDENAFIGIYLLVYFCYKMPSFCIESTLDMYLINFDLCRNDFVLNNGKPYHCEYNSLHTLGNFVIILVYKVALDCIPSLTTYEMGGHFTVVCLVTWPTSASEAGGDLRK